MSTISQPWYLIALNNGWRRKLDIKCSTVIPLNPNCIQWGKNTAVLDTNDQQIFLPSTKNPVIFSPLYIEFADGHRLEPSLLVTPDGVTYIATARSGHKLYFLSTHTHKYRYEHTDKCSFISKAYNAYQSCQLAMDNHNNQNDFLYKEDPEYESEYKFTLSPTSNPWSLATGIHDSIKQNELQGFIPHLTCSYTSWRFKNYLFEIVSPETSTGYISFIPCPDDTYIVKQKIFAEDCLKRIEKRTRNVSIPSNAFTEYIRKIIPNAVVGACGQFERERYDIDLESLDTGHHFSIMFDRCNTPSEQVLVQCEIEYMRTRSVLQRPMFDELVQVSEFAQEQLRLADIHFESSFYSKLSWIRDINR